MSSTTVLQPRGTIRYEEPSLALVLTLTSFVYLLNVARRVVDSLVGCGLVGQIAVGVVYGPVAKILPADVEHAFVALGYVGLVLVVFEGGLTLEPNRFARALPLSLASALVGILVPLALTFALFAAAFAYPTVDAFAAGSALASTSLGTTFFVLRSTGDAVDDTDIAQVLKGAALADDIVALVLLSVISSLGQGGGGIDAWTIARPIVASVALCLVSPVVIRFVLAPVFATEFVSNGVARGGKQGKLLIGVVVLSAYLAIAYYSGTTVLLGAFLAGVTLPFLSRARNDDMPVSSHKTTTATSNETEVGVDFVATYEYYVEPIQTTILVPFFFASIGYSIPFLELWRARVVWRGIIYSVLMVCGKVVVGVRVIVHDGAVAALSSSSSPSNRSGDVQQERESGPAANTFAELGLCRLQEGGADVIDRTRDERSEGRTSRRRGRVFVRETLPAATFLGLALVARGEIGVLVLQVAYNSAASSGDSSVVLGTEPYLVSIWAVAVCTVVGPIAFARVVATEWAREGVREWGRGRG